MISFAKNLRLLKGSLGNFIFLVCPLNEDGNCSSINKCQHEKLCNNDSLAQVKVTLMSFDVNWRRFEAKMFRANGSQEKD